MTRIHQPSYQNRRMIAAWVITLASVILGAWVSIFGAEIRAHSAFFYHGTFTGWAGLQPALSTVLFYATFGVWGIALLIRLLADDKQEWVRRERLMQAIHRVPNFDVIKDYPDIVRTLIAVLSEPIGGSNENERMSVLEVRITSVLKTVATMAREYARRGKVRYGANIMLVIKRDEAPEHVFRCLKFHDPSNRDVLQALLYGPKNLIIADVDETRAGDVQRVIPEIALPVQKQPAYGKRELLPGAPAALFTGELSVYENTERLLEHCADFSRNVQEHVAEYFSENGVGRHIRSFAAFRIGDAENPIGVLNIDSEGEDVLGRNAEFYPTFRALVEPLLAVMAPLLQEYGRLLWPKISEEES